MSIAHQRLFHLPGPWARPWCNVTPHQPEWTFWLWACDDEPPGFTCHSAREPIDGVVQVGELGLPDLRR
jgi:hypothetical protein